MLRPQNVPGSYAPARAGLAPHCLLAPRPMAPALPPQPTRASAQLFNIYPRLGALLRLHRPLLRKIEEVRAILRASLRARHMPSPGSDSVQSYMDALIQKGQVWSAFTPASSGGGLGAIKGLGCPSCPIPRGQGALALGSSVQNDPEGQFTEADMVACALDMVMAGTETTSATLQWAALLMCKHPKVQGERAAGAPMVRACGRCGVRACTWQTWREGMRMADVAWGRSPVRTRRLQLWLLLGRPGAGGAGPSAGRWEAPAAGGPTLAALHQRGAA